jgi:hypothetical protein
MRVNFGDKRHILSVNPELKSFRLFKAAAKLRKTPIGSDAKLVKGRSNSSLKKLLHSVSKIQSDRLFRSLGVLSTELSRVLGGGELNITAENGEYRFTKNEQINNDELQGLYQKIDRFLVNNHTDIQNLGNSAKKDAKLKDFIKTKFSKVFINKLTEDISKLKPVDINKIDELTSKVTGESFFDTVDEKSKSALLKINSNFLKNYLGHQQENTSVLKFNAGAALAFQQTVLENNNSSQSTKTNILKNNIESFARSPQDKGMAKLLAAQNIKYTLKNPEVLNDSELQAGLNDSIQLYEDPDLLQVSDYELERYDLNDALVKFKAAALQQDVDSATSSTEQNASSALPVSTSQQRNFTFIMALVNLSAKNATGLDAKLLNTNINELKTDGLISNEQSQLIKMHYRNLNPSLNEIEKLVNNDFSKELVKANNLAKLSELVDQTAEKLNIAEGNLDSSKFNQENFTRQFINQLLKVSNGLDKGTEDLDLYNAAYEKLMGTVEYKPDPSSRLSLTDNQNLLMQPYNLIPQKLTASKRAQQVATTQAFKNSLLEGTKVEQNNSIALLTKQLDKENNIYEYILDQLTVDSKPASSNKTQPSMKLKNVDPDFDTWILQHTSQQLKQGETHVKNYQQALLLLNENQSLLKKSVAKTDIAIGEPLNPAEVAALAEVKSDLTLVLKKVFPSISREVVEELLTKPDQLAENLSNLALKTQNLNNTLAKVQEQF